MKNLLFLFILVCSFISFNAASQVNIHLSSQTEIDNFKINYPNVTEIEGTLEIDGDGITNLDSLHLITSIGSTLEIYSVPDLISIEGLSSLKTIGNGESTRLLLHGTALTSVDGLEQLESVPALQIEENAHLNNLEGFSSLTAARHGVIFKNNASLTNFIGLENLTDVSSQQWLLIESNNMLTSLQGLENLYLDPGYVTVISIQSNPMLSECEIAALCDYLDYQGASVPNIHDNANGCNSNDEVRAACGTSINDLYLFDELNSSPNPFSTSTTISYTLKQSETVQLSVFNQLGQLVYSYSKEQQQGEQLLQWDAQGLAEGIYYYQLKAGDQVANGKMVKVK